MLLLFLLWPHVESSYSAPDYINISINFLSSVVGLQSSGYSIGFIDMVSGKMPSSIHNETSVMFNVTSLSGDSFIAKISFIDGVLSHYKLYPISGDFSGVSKSHEEYVNKVIEVLDNYYSLFGRGYIKTFIDLCRSSLSLNRKTVDSDVYRLVIDYEGRPNVYVAFWFYEKLYGNYTTPFRSIYIGLARDGLVTAFIDNMAVYKVGASSISVSRDDAIEIALPFIQGYAEEHGVNVVDVSVEFNIIKDLEGKRGSDLSLYPAWFVKAKFDRRVEGNTFGYVVGIWADNGEVYFHNPLGYFASGDDSLDSPQPSNTNEGEELADNPLNNQTIIYILVPLIGITLLILLYRKIKRSAV